MTDTTPDLKFRLDDFIRTHLAEHGDGWRLGLHWLATEPPKDEVLRVARIYRELHDGGVTGCDTMVLDATHYPTFIDFLKDSPHERLVENGIEEMAEINERQGTDYPSWPARCFAVSFDESFLIGFADVVNTAARVR